jgi:hypothetical protein
VGFEEIGGDVPGAAVNEEDGGSRHSGERGIVPFW